MLCQEQNSGRMFLNEQSFYLHQSFSVLLIDSFTSVDNIDYNITFTSPSAFVPTLMIMVPL